MIRLGVVGHPRYETLGDVLRRVASVADRLGVRLYVEPDLRAHLPEADVLTDPAQVEAMLSLGGDGTFLRAARFAEGFLLPILGVNLGRLGFLTTGGPGELEATLERLAAGDYEHEDRIGLSAVVVDASERVRARWFALNDVVLHKGGYARVVSLSVSAGDEVVASYSADGVVVASPTGSTAYNLSLGGPVVFPTLECLIVTPVSAHTLAMRPLVLPGDAEVRIRAEPGPEALLVTVDGQEGTSFRTDDTLVVRRAPRPVRIVRFPGASFFATMRRKLGWGGLLERDERTGC